MTGERIEVTGLREFQAQLRAMDSDLPKQLRLALNAGADLVIGYASDHMPKRTGAARGSLKARSSQREARIALGGSKAPYAAWLDFGGQGRRRGRPAKRTFMKEGRYVYRGLSVHRADVVEAMESAVVELARGAGLEVDHG